MSEKITTFDVVVVGCGIAGLSAAATALQAGARVAILERSVKEERGGNTRWTEALLRMKSDTQVSDDFETHFSNNAGHYLDPELIAETARDWENWSGIVKTLGFTDPDVITTFASSVGPTVAWLKVSASNSIFCRPISSPPASRVWRRSAAAWRWSRRWPAGARKAARNFSTKPPRAN